MKVLKKNFFFFFIVFKDWIGKERKKTNPKKRTAPFSVTSALKNKAEQKPTEKKQLHRIRGGWVHLSSATQ